MTDKTPDDIFALCARLNIDGDRYRVFPKKEVRREVLATVPPAETPSAPAIPAFALGDESRSEFPESCEAESDSAEIVRQTNRTMLRNLSRNIQRESFVPSPDVPANPLEQSVCVYAAAGGVGTTTVVATLARIYSKRRKRAVLVDGRKESLLPILFGGRTSEFANGFYFGSDASEQLPASVFSPDSWLSRRFGPVDSAEEWFESCLSYAEDQADHLIVDVWPELAYAPLPERMGGVNVLVAVPDLSSMIGARSYMNRMKLQVPDRPCLCVLNKFDRSLALHNELRVWFEQIFDETICLSRSDLADESLAEGMTVVDWAPASALSQEYQHLLGRIEQTWQTQEKLQVADEEFLCR